MFTEHELDGLPTPVRRYLSGAIAPGTPLARSVQVRMRGRIKVGRWVPFRARELLVPHLGLVWTARAGVLIGGYDSYARGRGAMDWKLAGLLRVASASGPDVDRAAAERAGGEAIWLPTALLPRWGVTWSATSDEAITAHFHVDGHPVELHLGIDAAGRVRSVVFDRWHDAEGDGRWTTVPCGGDITGYRTFGGLTVPSAGTLGWYYGTDRWADGEFFRYELTALEPAR